MKLKEAIDKRWLIINLHVLENEASHLCKEDIDESNSQYQLVPPNNHRHNEAERAIRTFKEHFIRVLAGEDAKFPMSMWDHLLEKNNNQCENTSSK